MAIPENESATPLLVPPADLMLSAIVDSSDDAIISKSLDGLITTWNRAAERIFGFKSDEIIGRSIEVLVPPDRLEEEQDIMRRVKSGERVEHFETVRRKKNGGLIDVSVTISPIRDSQGIVMGASKIARDISERKLGSRATLLLAAIVNSSEDAIISKSLNGIITSWNAGATRLFGYSETEMLGKPVLMLIPEDRKDEEAAIIARIQKGERVEHFETIRQRKDGSLVAVSLTISPVKDEFGNICGASKIARDISELKRVANEREQLLESERIARVQAEQANRMKDDFLATVSHELRSPLNAIVGWTQVMRESNYATEDVRVGVNVIDESFRSQARLIEDLLDLNRISSGKMILDIQQVDMTTLLKDVILSVQHAADLKQISIKSISDGRGGLMGDKQRLQQIFWNLLSNSIKFTPKGGKIVITSVRVNSHWEVSVADNGRGIAHEFLPHVFERFSQDDSSTTRRFGGLGIGLALVKQFVELHGGEVRAESLGRDKGATFTISLPLLVARHFDVGPSAEGSTEKPSVRSGELAGVSVLAVDDDEESLKVLSRILTARGAEIRTASNVQEALELAKTFNPNVILSDIGMPGKDGYEFIRQIREMPELCGTPAVALTALARVEDRMRALEAGFQTHVSKPVTPGELVAVLRSLSTLNVKRTSI